MELGLKGRKAIVTGASRGIGLAIAEGLAKEGMDVAICARGAEGVDKAVAAISAHGTKVIGSACDVGDPEALKAFIENSAEELGGLDTLVNNPSGFGHTDDEDGWKAGLDVDLMGVVRATWAATPFLEKSEAGSLLHISSISGIGPSSSIAYGAVKAAVIQLTQSHAAKLAEKRIRVNCIAPGSVEFPGGSWEKRRLNDTEYYNSVLARIPFGRMGTPEEMANLAVFLCSDAASWITGQTIAADGGQML